MTQHFEPVQGNSLVQVRGHFGLEKDALLEEFVRQRVVRLRGEQGDPRHWLCLMIQILVLGQETAEDQISSRELVQTRFRHG